MNLRVFEPPCPVELAGVRARDRVAIGGLVTGLELRRWAPGTCVLEATVADGTGSLVASFVGRTDLPGLDLGAPVVMAGIVLERRGRLTIMNPQLWLQERADETAELRGEAAVPSYA